MVRVKICGITRPDDAMLAVECGADAVGFIFAESPVRVTLETVREIAEVLPPFLTRVGVFTDAQKDDLHGVWRSGVLDAVQCFERVSSAALREAGVPTDRLIRAIRVRDGGALESAVAVRGTAAAIHLDAFSSEREGGTGTTFDWRIARAIGDRGMRVVLAGGLTPANVDEAIRAVQPYAVDVRSGVEREPGIKDPDKVAAFCRAVRAHA